MEQQTIVIEKILECPQHHPVGKQHPQRPRRKKQTKGKSHKCHPDVVKRYGDKHRPRTRRIIHPHWLPCLDILNRHIDITVPQYQTHKIRVMRCREKTYPHRRHKKRQGKRQRPPMPCHQTGILLCPEPPQRLPLQRTRMDGRLVSAGKRIQVTLHVTSRIKRAGICQVIGQLHEIRCYRLHIQRFPAFLHAFPLLPVEGYKTGFFHIAYLHGQTY